MRRQGRNPQLTQQQLAEKLGITRYQAPPVSITAEQRQLIIRTAVAHVRSSDIRFLSASTTLTSPLF